MPLRSGTIRSSSSTRSEANAGSPGERSLALGTPGLHDASRMAGSKVSFHFYKALNWLRQKSAMSLGCMVNSSYCCLVINTQRMPRHLKPLSAALLIYAP